MKKAYYKLAFKFRPDKSLNAKYAAENLRKYLKLFFAKLYPYTYT
ncbi:MAG: hypothetical protein LBU10_04800 [Endomicrobium sp.]|nr:hypothetical protein [Endomicrobium sp.]